MVACGMILYIDLRYLNWPLMRDAHVPLLGASSTPMLNMFRSPTLDLEERRSLTIACNYKAIWLALQTFPKQLWTIDHNHILLRIKSWNPPTTWSFESLWCRSTCKSKPQRLVTWRNLSSTSSSGKTKVLATFLPFQATPGKPWL